MPDSREESWLSWLFSLLGTRKRIRQEGDLGDDESGSKRIKGELSGQDSVKGGAFEEETEHSPLSLLTHRPSILSFQSSLTMIIMRGLPGSGKSSLVGRILKIYPQAEVCSADAYFTQADGSYQYDRNKIKEAHTFSQERAETLCRDACNLVIVDNTHVKRWELQPYLNTAAKFRYSVVILEPQTPWARNPEQLAVRNSHNVNENAIRKKLKEWQEIRPRYFCWLLNLADSHLLLMQAKNILHLAATSCPSLKEWMNECDSQGEDGEEEGSGSEQLAQLSAVRFCENNEAQIQKESESDGTNMKGESDGSQIQSESVESQIENYSRESCSGSSRDLLHCTARYLRRGMEVDEKTLMGQGRSHKLMLTSLTLTKDTLGARVQLNEEQLDLWHEEEEEDAFNRVTQPLVKQEPVSKSGSGKENKDNSHREKDPEKVVDLEKHLLACRSSLVHRKQKLCSPTNLASSSSLQGLKAHITLGCRKGVRPMQTGLDQLALLKGKVVEETKIPAGVLARIDDCGWVINLDADITVDALFTGVYV